MGRGRQKAKQRKVARTLKYSTPETDYRALERELVSRDETDDYQDDVTEDDSYEYDEYEKYSQYFDDEESDDDEDEDSE